MKRFARILLCLALCTAMLPAVLSLPLFAATEADSVAINDCDEITEWTLSGGKELSFNTEDNTEGRGCVAALADIPAHGTTALALEGSFPLPTDISGMDVLEFDLYLSDKALVSSSIQALIEIGSAGDGSRQVLRWMNQLSAYPLGSGWNSVRLKLTDAESDGFRADRMNYFRLYFLGISPSKDMKDAEIRIDDLRARAYDKEQKMLVNCDSTEGWSDWCGHLCTDSEDKTEGKAALFNEAVIAEGGNMVFEYHFAPQNIQSATCIEMDIYVSDMAGIVNSTYGLDFEITSSDRCDEEELSWELGAYITKNGWNHLRLPISAGNPSGSHRINLSAVNFIRFHILNVSVASSDSLRIKIDNITAATPVIPPDPTPTAEPTPTADPTPTAEPTDIPNDDSPSDGADKTTNRRAVILLLVMLFVIVSTDIVAVALRRRHRADAVGTDAGKE